MQYYDLIEKLKKAGINFSCGMSEFELDLAESVFGFRFPLEVREFLRCAVPVGQDFFDYRDFSSENQKRFQDFQKTIAECFRFDLEQNRGDMLSSLGPTLGFTQDSADFDKAVMDYLHRSVKLIPFFGHRCFFDGMDDMPIVSFWQPVDSIFYGESFRDYLEVEFIGKPLDVKTLPEERLPETGIWNDLVTP